MNAAVEALPEVVKSSLMLVPIDFVPMEWPKVYDMLQPAVERSGGRWSMPALLQALCLGEQALWLMLEDEKIIASAITTQVVNYPNSRILAFQFLGGKGFDEWSDEMLATLERYAKDCGCNGMEAVGRFGFWPFFRGHDWKKSYCTYQKIFSEE